MDLARHTFLVTGGSSGLGAACVRMFVENGGNVVIADLKPPSETLPENVVFHKTDVTDTAAVRAALAQGRDRFGRIDGAVICAGVIHGERVLGRSGPFDLDAFRRVIEINLIGTFNVLRLTAEALQGNEPNSDGERGVIVMTSSVAAFEGQIGQAAYAASKGGVASLTLPAARDLGQHGIRVVSVAPGVFETPMMQQVSPKYRQSLEEQIPFPPRFGRPEEFAALVRHIVENPLLNGGVIRLDGALRMGPR